MVLPLFLKSKGFWKIVVVLAVALALFGAGAATGLQYGTRASVNAEVKRLKKALKNEREAHAKTKATVVKVERQRAKSDAKLKEALRDDKETQEWWSADIPQPAREFIVPGTK